MDNKSVNCRWSPAELQMALAIGLCCLLYMLEDRLQVMTACIAVLLCVQDSFTASFKAGLTRLEITFAGGFVAVLVVLFQEYVSASAATSVIAVMLGVLLTFLCCRLMRVPVFSNRIGAVTFILVVFTRPGIGRVEFAVIRWFSTLVGVLAVLLVTFAVQKLRRCEGLQERS